MKVLWENVGFLAFGMEIRGKCDEEAQNNKLDDEGSLQQRFSGVLVTLRGLSVRDTGCAIRI